MSHGSWLQLYFEAGKTIAFIESDGLGLTFNGIAKGALGLESVLSG